VKDIKNILIVGLGLIGGSIALGIKRDHPTIIISGYDVNASALEEGKKKKTPPNFDPIPKKPMSYSFVRLYEHPK
jgi:Prephenate dehydrogenase